MAISSLIFRHNVFALIFQPKNNECPNSQEENRGFTSR